MEKTMLNTCQLSAKTGYFSPIGFRKIQGYPIIMNFCTSSNQKKLRLNSLKFKIEAPPEDTQNPISPLIEHFSKVEDPRIVEYSNHLLIDIIVIAVCAIISGANTWVDIENFGNAKQDWLKQVLKLKLPNGIPSHDTFGRVFRLIDAEQFQEAFVNWVQAVSEITEGEIVPIDGKTLRRSHNKAIGKRAIHMVSAWASSASLVLGQVKVDDKSNEITAIPKLLDMLTISGCIVTIDAMGCQKAIAAKIIDNDADYVLALKGNQSGLFEDVKDVFSCVDFQDCDYHKTTNKGHGRIETRQCWTTSNDKYLDDLHNREAWKGLQTIAMVKAERQIGDIIQAETRYFIASLDDSAQSMLNATRTHWNIENNLHWVLDVAFREDDCRVRMGNAPQNFATLRHIALNFINQDTSAKGGTQAKRLNAGWDDDFRLKVLEGLNV